MTTNICSISLKMITTQPIPAEFPSLAAYINSFLPPTIRIWGYIRTLSGFQARQSVPLAIEAVLTPLRGCDSRVYEYLLPSYALLPPRHGTPLANKLDASSPGWRTALSAADAFWLGEGKDEADEAWRATTTEEEKDKYLNAKRASAEKWRGWRVDGDTMNRFREVIAGYKGTQ
jgi:tRNA pseudouridine38-40 synthase